MVEISIVIPAHNEQDSLESTVQGILTNVKIKDYEILICNDHSTDNTLKIAQKLSKNDKRVRALSNTGDKGFGNVIRFGFSKARGKYLIPMMADACDDPRTLNVMYEKIQEGYDVVVGSRYISGGNRATVHDHFKGFCSWFMGVITRTLLGMKIHDGTNPYRLISAKAIRSVELTSNAFDISFELLVKLHRKGYRFTEVPTVWTDRTTGDSKFNVFKMSKLYLRWIFKR